jgi:hypothetical protein
MRCFKLLTLLLAWFCLGHTAEAAANKIVKVLPHFLDQEGRHTLSPSLYERDAYQAHLRGHKELISALRFDIQWKAPAGDKSNLKMRVEIRGGKHLGAQPVLLEQAIKPGKLFGNWAALTLPKETYEQLGQMVAWRVTLWNGADQIGEQKSFLW